MNLSLLYRASDHCENDTLFEFAANTINALPLPYTYDWSHALNRVHPIISQELDFVVKQVIEELECEALVHPVGGWRRAMVSYDVFKKVGRWQWSCRTPLGARQYLLMHVGAQMMRRQLFESCLDLEMGMEV